MMRRLIATLVGCGVLLAPGALAQRWTELGPAPISNAQYTGRISAIACHPTNANVYFVTGADGGVWRTTDGGATWMPLTDTAPTTAMGAIAIDPSNPQIIYAGTGESNYANHSRYGLGILKSTDGGDTWQHLAADVFGGRCISRILIDPSNPQTLYASVTRAGGFPELAAAKGHPQAAGPLGVFRSTDGGATWSLLPGLPNLSCTDLAMHPAQPSVLYACVGRIFGHAQNGIYKSTNSGASWTKLTNGLPGSDVGRISMAIAPGDPQRLYCLIAQASNSRGGSASTEGAYRSDDAGNTWTRLSSLGNIQATYGWYLNVVSVNPNDSDTAFFGGLNLVRTTNAGSSFSNVTPPHVDMHALAWDAAGRLVAGDDGGVHRSTNFGSSWIALNDGLGTIQFYAGLSTDPTNDTIVFGGAQDNGTNRRNTNTRLWTHVMGGDGGWTRVDQQSPNRVFAEYQGTGNLFRSTNGGGSYGGASSGINGGDRNCFLPPYLIHPTDPNRMLYATHRVYRSTNGGSSWSAISGDLTDGSGAIRALAQSHVNPERIYAATNDGNVHVSTDGGTTWSQIADNHPGWPRVTREITTGRVDELVVYLCSAVFGADQIRRSLDGGQTWTTLDGNLPDVPVNVVEEVFRFTQRQLFAGTDHGLFFSPDDGTTWQRFGEGLPHVPVIDILIDEPRQRLIVGTQGRGAWQAPLFPTPAELQDIVVNVGSVLDGGIDEVLESDDTYLHTRSGFGATLTDLHLLEMDVAAVTTATEAQRVDVSIESHIVGRSGAAAVQLRNWSTNEFETVHQYQVNESDQLVRINDLDPSRYVRDADGRIDLRIRHVVIVPQFAFRFDSRFDLIELFVN